MAFSDLNIADQKDVVQIRNINNSLESLSEEIPETDDAASLNAVLREMNDIRAAKAVLATSLSPEARRMLLETGEIEPVGSEEERLVEEAAIADHAWREELNAQREADRVEAEEQTEKKEEAPMAEATTTAAHEPPKNKLIRKFYVGKYTVALLKTPNGQFVCAVKVWSEARNKMVSKELSRFRSEPHAIAKATLKLSDAIDNAKRRDAKSRPAASLKAA